MTARCCWPPAAGARQLQAPAGRAWSQNRHPPARHLAGLPRGMHPRRGGFVLQLPVRSSTAMHSALFAQAQGAQPQPRRTEPRHRGRRTPAAARDRPACQRARPAAPESSPKPRPCWCRRRTRQDWTQAWQGDAPGRPACRSRPAQAPAPHLPLVLAPNLVRATRPGLAHRGRRRGAWAVRRRSPACPRTGRRLAANPSQPASPAASGGAASQPCWAA